MNPFAHAFPFDPAYGYDLESLLTLQPPLGPPDLAAFCQQTYCEARQIPLNLTSRRVSSPHPEVDVFEVEFDAWGRRRIGAWLTAPRNGTVRRGVVCGHGYGGREEPEFDLPVGPDCAVIFPCARGFGRSRFTDIPDVADAHVLTGIVSRETYVHRGCVAELWGAATALIECFPETARSLYYRGTSFGGGIGAMAVAWDERFASAYLCVPSFGNHPLRIQLPCTGSGGAVREYSQQHPEVLETLQYFDAASMARHIRVPVLCDCALFDPAVPPPGQFSVFNALGGPKQLIVRSAGHFDYPPLQAEEDRQACATQEAWFAALDKFENEIGYGSFCKRSISAA